MSISKKLRFQIFERDNFTCQYCGKNPVDHDVVLEIDHAVSKKDGGENGDENLITSCFACNRGKSKKSIILKKKINAKQELKNAKEQLEQIKIMMKLGAIKRKIENEKLDWLDEFIGEYTDALRTKMRKIIKREIRKGHSLSVLQESIEITYEHFCNEEEFYTDDFAKYFYGVLRIKKNE